jgi:glutamate dehydrogenase
VLLAYAKMELYDSLLGSELPDDSYFGGDLAKYFPPRLRETYAQPISEHRLRREIITTTVTNSMINRVGATFVNTIREQTGATAPDVARAYTIVRDTFGLPDLWEAVEALDNKVPAEVQTKMLIEMQNLVTRETVWFLRNGRQPLDIRASVSEFQPGVAKLRGCLVEVLSENDRKQLEARAKVFIDTGVPKDLARQVASFDQLVAACDVVRLAGLSGGEIEAVARVYFGVGDRFALDWLREKAMSQTADTYWQKLAIGALVDDFFNHQSTLAQDVLSMNGSAKPTAKPKGKAKAAAVSSSGETIAAWTATRPDAVSRTDRLLTDIRSSEPIDLAMLAVANGQLRALLAR